ncbi:MAG: hypothetical protein ACO3LE_06775, partial [Bdellovibrionota bacterium]
ALTQDCKLQSSQALGASCRASLLLLRDSARWGRQIERRKNRLGPPHATNHLRSNQGGGEALSECARNQGLQTKSPATALKFPASDEEKMLVHQAMRELKQSLAKSAQLAESLLYMLDENFLAVTAEYRKELLPDIDRIGAAMWQLNIRFLRTLTQKERIIKSENEAE